MEQQAGPPPDQYPSELIPADVQPPAAPGAAAGAGGAPGAREDSGPAMLLGLSQPTAGELAEQQPVQAAAPSCAAPGGAAGGSRPGSEQPSGAGGDAGAHGAHGARRGRGGKRALGAGMGSAVESANWCHQCKVRKLVVQCTSLHPRCPKRYCDQCLCSHYGESLEGTVGLADWACPFCRGLCVCAACKRRALGAAHSSLAAAQPPSQQPAAVSAPPGAPLGAGAAGALSEGAAHGGQPAPMARAGCCGAQVAPGGNLQLWCGSTPGSDAATVAAAAAALGRPPGGAASAVRPAAGALAQSQAVTIAFQPPPLPPPPPREPSARMPYKCSKCGLPKQGHVCLGSPQPPPPGAPVAATTPAPPAQAPLLLQAQLQHHTALSRPTPQQPLALPTDALRAAIHATGSAFSAGMGAEELSALLADARPGQRELPRAGAGGAALASLCAQLAQGPAALPQPQQPPLQPIAQRPAPPQPGAPGKGAPGEAEGAGLGSNGCGGAGAASLHGDVPVRNAEASADDESASKRLRARIEM